MASAVKPALASTTAKTGQTRTWMRRLNTGLALFGMSVGLSIGGALPAHASPDKDKDVFTSQHVDAPVPAWDGANQSLYIKANGVLAENSVLYLGRGWRGNVAKHLYTVPGNDERMAFLGDPGDMWLSAPQDPGDGNTPIWAGIGVDGTLSSNADSFENGNYVLDIVDVKGPGRVESFIATRWRVNRILSSTDLEHRTVWNPRHMHAYTLFSKPGRYEINVAAVTRSADGTTLYSSPVTPIVWQVGGADPRNTSILDYGAAYNEARAARTDGKTQGGTLTVKPKAVHEIVGDDALTDFRFSTGNAADQGTLVVLIDGFYLTEVPVTNGEASFNEMIGDEESSFQAIYIPSDANSARLATDAVTYTRLAQTPASTTGTVPGPFTAAPSESPEMLPSNHRVESNHVDITFTPIPGDDPDKYMIEATGDEALDAEIKLGWYEDLDSFPDCSYERQLTAGHSSGIADILGYCRTNAKHMLVTINPHPYANVKPIVIDISDWDLGEGRTFNVELPVREQADDLTPAPRIPGWVATAYDPATAPHPAPPDPAPSTPPAENPPSTDHTPPPPNTDTGQSGTGQSGTTGEEPNDDQDASNSSKVPSLLTDAIKIFKGHLDIRLHPAADQSWTLAIKDDSLIGSKHSEYRTPESVTIVVPAGARLTRTKTMDGAQFDFLGPIGTTHYVLDQTEREGMPWPGFSTEDVDYSHYPKGIDFKLSVRKAPENGRIMFFTASDIGQAVDLHIDSASANRHTLHTKEATHLHGNWVFSQAGIYEVDVDVTSGGQTLARGSLVFDVDSRDADTAQGNADNAPIVPLVVPPFTPPVTPSDPPLPQPAPFLPGVHNQPAPTIENPISPAPRRPAPEGSSTQNRITRSELHPTTEKKDEQGENTSRRRRNSAASLAGARATITGNEVNLPQARGALGLSPAAGSAATGDTAQSADAAQSGDTPQSLKLTPAGRVKGDQGMSDQQSGAAIAKPMTAEELAEAQRQLLAMQAAQPPTGGAAPATLDSYTTYLYMAIVALGSSLITALVITLASRKK